MTEDKPKREAGYYWVKYGGTWLVAKYYTVDTHNIQHWGFGGMVCHDHNLDEIDETRIVRPSESQETIETLMANTDLKGSFYISEYAAFMITMLKQFTITRKP